MIEDIVNNNGYDYVDLGLPSRTLWATMNVGATKLSDPGMYFQFGDIQGYTKDQVGKSEGQKAFTWKDYKFSINGSDKDFIKYTTKNAKLKLEDDAAHINMKGGWHIPSPEQCQELIDNTTTIWTRLDNMGMKFVSKKDPLKFIFIAAAGDALDGSVKRDEWHGFVWTSRLSPNAIRYGQRFYFLSERISLNSFVRCNGLSVRGVIG